MLRILFLLFLCNAGLFAQVTAKAYTDTTDYLIGDRIKLTIEISYPENYHVVTPNFTDSLTNVDVWEVKAPVIKQDNGNITSVYELILSRFDSADVTIPPFPVMFKQKNSPAQKIAPLFGAADSTYNVIKTEPVNFTVHTMKVNREEEIKDIKAPVLIPLDWRIILLYVLLLAGVITLAAQIYIYLKYKKKTVPEEKKVFIPRLLPHVWALKELSELETKQLWQKGEVKQYHTEITGIIRRYFEERYKMPALELSTTEVIENLSQRNETAQVIKITSMFLSNADLVKFAKFNPVPSVNEEMMYQAKEIVKLTEFVPFADTVAEAEADV